MNLPAATAWSSSDVRAWPGHGGPDTRAAMSVSSRTSIRARTHTVPIGDPDGHSLSKTAISDDSSRHQGSRVVAAKWVVATFGAHATRCQSRQHRLPPRHRAALGRRRRLRRAADAPRHSIEGQAGHACYDSIFPSISHAMQRRNHPRLAG